MFATVNNNKEEIDIKEEEAGLEEEEPLPLMDFNLYDTIWGRIHLVFRMLHSDSQPGILLDS